MSAIKTLAPSRMKVRAMASPIPPSPPVIIATFPSNLSTQKERKTFLKDGRRDIKHKDEVKLKNKEDLYNIYYYFQNVEIHVHGEHSIHLLCDFIKIVEVYQENVHFRKREKHF